MRIIQISFIKAVLKKNSNFIKKNKYTFVRFVVYLEFNKLALSKTLTANSFPSKLRLANKTFAKFPFPMIF